ncbi:MAG: hypothetical protein WAR39_03265 [Prevotella sp.]|jgi:hypothetical protein
MIKRIFSVILIITLSFTSFIPISAKTSISSENEFKEIVEKSKYYKDYADEVVQYDVLRKVETDEGTRFTIEYNLKTEEDEYVRNLVFIGDENGEFLEVLLTIGKDDLLSAVDLIRKYTTNVHIETKGRVYQCTKYTCKAWTYKPNYSPQQGCSAVVGQPCNALALYGKPIAAIICKVGVWAACNISIDKVCTSYYETLDVCEL